MQVITVVGLVSSACSHRVGATNRAKVFHRLDFAIQQRCSSFVPN